MKYASQPRIKGLVREWSGESLDPLILEALRKIQRQYPPDRRPSLSWMKASILADALNIKTQPRYYEVEPQKRMRRRAS